MKLEHSTILIVDDDAETLALLHEILSKEGYDISTAPHPKAAFGADWGTRSGPRHE